MEDLIDELNQEESGVRIGEIIINNILYADDIILICNNAEDLEKLLNIATNYGIKNEIKFNPNKTQYVIFDDKKPTINEQIRFGGIQIEKITKIKYLGVHLDNKLNSLNHFQAKKKSALMKMRKLKKCGYDSKVLNTEVKTNQFETCIRPVLSYGLENISMNKSSIKELQTLESMIIKRSFNLSSRFIRSKSLLKACKIESFEFKLNKAKLSFLRRLLNNEFTLNLIINLFETESRIKCVTNDETSLIGEMIKKLNIIDTSNIDVIIEEGQEELESRGDEYYSEVLNTNVEEIRRILEKSGDERRNLLKEKLEVKLLSSEIKTKTNRNKNKSKNKNK